MSWLVSRALEAEFSAALCSDGEPSARSNGSPTPLAYCAPDKMTAFSRLSRFGATFKPLMANRGAELLTWYLAGFHARTLAPPERAQGSTAHDPECGVTWHESSVKYDRDSRSWRTHQCLWDEDLPESLVTLPKWGMTRNGVVYQRQPLAQYTSESDCGSLLPTIVASEGKGAARNRFRGSIHYRGSKMAEALRSCYDDPIYLNPSFAELAMMWPQGWTDLKPLVMGKYLSAQPKPSEFCQMTEEAAK